MDAVERVEDAIAIAAYVQALVKRAAEAPSPPPQSALEDALVRENKWQAIRYGLDATVIDATATPIPIRDHILSTLDDLAQTAAELQSERSLFDIERIVRAGTGADRQLATFAETTDLRAVTRQIVTETRAAAPVVA
jgi:carboxylate-amine ligase